MSQRNSGYDRIKNDLYETPEWATQALLPYIPSRITRIWEPACGGMKMVRELVKKYPVVVASSLEHGLDFLDATLDDAGDVHAIITNPPYSLTHAFVRRALGLMEPVGGLVAMLLPAEWDYAITRSHLFKWHPHFALKLVLTKRIVWIEREDGKKAQPASNHAWYVWDFGNGPKHRMAWYYEDSK